VDLLGACPAPDVLQPSIEAPVIQGDEVPKRMSHRTRQPPPKLQEYVTYTIKHRVYKVLSYDKLSSDHRAFLTSISEEHEPKSFQEA
jgi:hypothetical protein